jgi:Predicted membrane protein
MVVESQMQAKRPVSAALAGPYGHPFHPILVTVPIGAWVTSLVFDIGSHVVHDPDFLTRGSTWLIAIGVLGALAAAMIGFLDLFAIPTGTRAYRTGLIHMTLNLLVTVAYAGNFWWRSATDSATGTVGAGMIALSAVSMAALGASGFLGGKLAYHYGVRVADESTQAEGFVPGTSQDTDSTH